MPCIPAADIKVIVELHLKAEPLPGNGWGGLRLISIEDQPRPRQQFLATGEIFFWSPPIPFGHWFQRRKSITGTICRHCDKHFTHVISFDPSSRFEKVHSLHFYRGGKTATQIVPNHLPKLLIDLGIFCHNGLPSILKGLFFSEKDLACVSILIRVEVVKYSGR